MGNHYPTVTKLAFKPDVRMTITNLDPCMIHALQVAMLTAPPLGGETLVVTSATDSVHKAHSLHYVSRAFDLRYAACHTFGSIVIPPEHDGDGAEYQNRQARFWAGRMRQQLGPDYDVIVEGNHIHVEWDPK